MKLEDKVKKALAKYIRGETDEDGDVLYEDRHHKIHVTEPRLGSIVIYIHETKLGGG